MEHPFMSKTAKRIVELERINSRQNKDLLELVNRVKELKNDVAVMQAAYEQQKQLSVMAIERQGETMKVMMAQIEKTLAQIMQHVQTEERPFTARTFINEDY